MGKKSKECKIEFVDNINTNFDIKFCEIVLKKYRIYARTKEKGWELLKVTTDKEKALSYIKNLSPKIYNGRILIEEDKKNNIDLPIDFERE